MATKKTKKQKTPTKRVVHYKGKGCASSKNKSARTTTDFNKITCKKCVEELEKKLVLVTVDHWEKGQVTPKVHRIPVSVIMPKLEHAFSIGANITEACIYAGINRNTYYDWCKRYPRLSDKFDGLRMTPILEAKETIAKSLKDTKDAQWYAERKIKSEFSTRVENMNLDVEDYDEMTEISETIDNWKPKKKKKTKK